VRQIQQWEERERDNTKRRFERIAWRNRENRRYLWHTCLTRGLRRG
jgi:hypothetical protein